MDGYIFDKLKANQKKLYRLKSYDDVLLNSIVPMIQWSGLPESVNKRVLEEYRITEGAAAIWELNGDYIVSHVQLGGEPYTDGFGSKAICTTNNGVVREFDNWRDNNNLVIIWNNSIYSPDLNIGRFSDLLTELETSLSCNIIYSRLYPMPVAKSEHLKKAIEAALNNMEIGKFQTILDDGFINPLTQEGESAIDIVNLTDVANSDKLQYLSHMRDDIFRWFYSIYGMNTQGSAKMAQQTVDEVNQDNNASMIIPIDRLNMAKEAVSELNTKFGFNASIEFGQCWQSRLYDMDNNGDAVIDESPEVASESPEVASESPEVEEVPDEG